MKQVNAEVVFYELRLRAHCYRICLFQLRNKTAKDLNLTAKTPLVRKESFLMR